VENGPQPASKTQHPILLLLGEKAGMRENFLSSNFSAVNSQFNLRAKALIFTVGGNTLIVLSIMRDVEPIKLSDGQTLLIIVKDHRVIEYTWDMGLPHVEFVK